MRLTVLLILSLVLRAQDLPSALGAAAAAGADFVGYEVPMAKGHGTVCSNWTGGFHTRQDALLLDGPTRLRVLFEVKDGKPGKLLLASDDCRLEPGSKTVKMLTGVTPEASIRYLMSRGDDSAIYAVSVHNHPLATRSLIDAARDASNRSRQKKAFFWLARSKDPAAEAFILQILR
jgi:hypothetical protein